MPDTENISLGKKTKSQNDPFMFLENFYVVYVYIHYVDSS